MLSKNALDELLSAWLPHTTDAGLDRVIDLLEAGSPLLIHGCFTRAVPMGCLATHIAWHHPRTRHLTLDAGITWLHHVAGLNPATSSLLRDWDRGGTTDLELRADLLHALKQEQRRRRTRQPAERKADLVEA
jgi:hypothetical protein